MLRIERKSPFTGEKSAQDLPISLRNYALWQMGRLTAAEAFPECDEFQMVFLITGMTQRESIDLAAVLFKLK